MININILVIDDEYRFFEGLLKDYFEINSQAKNISIRFDFNFCDNIEDGFKCLKSSNSFDLIILDLLFALNNGKSQKSFELLRTIKEKYSHIPVLLLSATSNIDDLQKAGFDSEYHPDDFMSKNDSINKIPSDFDILFDKTIELLKKFGRIYPENGILITHGTDTMAWAFAVLRYGLYNLRTNVVITGSQLPLEGTFSPSDAIGNMLTSVKLLNMLVPPNIIQVFNDGVHIFNKNLVKVKKWSVDAFFGNSFGKIETEELKIEEDDVIKVAPDKINKLKKLNFIKTGGTIDSKMTSSGLSSYDVNYTYEYLKNLKVEYFNEFDVEEINPKDSSFMNPFDWTKLLNSIKSTELSDADTNFDWNILPILCNPFLKEDYYEFFAKESMEKYSGTIVLGYGAGNVNVIGSNKTKPSFDYAESFSKKFGVSQLKEQQNYSLISFFEKIEEFNKNYPNNYKFIVMSSQVPIDNYDIDYEAGQIPLYYGALPSGDLSYPEAQTKLAFILGHKELIKNEAKKNNLTYEQLVKSCFLAGVKFNKKKNQNTFLHISEKECNCKLVIHHKNVFVKNSFIDGLNTIIEHLKK